MKQAAAFFFFLLLILFPKISVEGARQGLFLWALTLVPTLLPFLIVTKLLLQGKIANRFFFPYLLFVGYFCGYPTGAVIINRLYETSHLEKKQADLFLCFCNHASPAFLFNFVYYNYVSFSCTLPRFLCSIYIPCVLWSIFFYCFFGKPHILSDVNDSSKKQQNLEEIFSDSVNTIIKIGCFMLIFSILIQIAFSLFSKRSVLLCIASCFLEITNGVHYLSGLPLSEQIKTALIGGLCSFGGYCSIAQVKSVLSKELSVCYYILFKLCTGFTVFLLLYLSA